MRRIGPRVVISAVLLAVASSESAAAQISVTGQPFRAGSDPVPILARPVVTAPRYILIRLDANELYVVEGTQAIWSAPVATGGGFRLESQGRSWHFETPRGVFRIQRKELDPIWIKPDWAYFREGRRPPPLDAPERRQRGMLGNTALFIGYELALHGTDKPHLVLNPDPEERRVSHGCIRLTDDDARTLYHMVDVGTLVLIY